MNCKKIKKLLLTDYLDKADDAEIRMRVQEHLKLCDDCRRLEERIRSTVVLPFKDPLESQVPDAVWRNIKSKIAQRQARRVTVLDVIMAKLKAFLLPKPQLAFAAAMIIFLASFTIIAKYTTDKNQIEEYFAQQISFYAMLGNDEENDLRDYTDNSDISMESYLF